MRTTKGARHLISVMALAVVALALPAAVVPAAAQSDFSIVGAWSDPRPWPHVAVHMNVLPDGNVLTWNASGGAAVWSPAADVFTPATNPLVNVFCAGHAFLPDGRLLVTGGHNAIEFGTADASLFDPVTYAWTQGPDMNGGRWYPTSTTLATGEVTVVGGFTAPQTSNQVSQVWQADESWRDLAVPPFKIPSYPWMFAAPNGKLFLAGPQPLAYYLDASGGGAWTKSKRAIGTVRSAGTTVLYGDGKVMIVGGRRTASNTAEVIDLRAKRPAWRYVTPMTYPRRHLNATLLPDESVLVTGGTATTKNDTTAAVLAAELWDPATETWTTLASMHVRRLYHSTAALLPDGRVLSAGGQGQGDFKHLDAEIFTPPYLFAPDGSPAVRPTIAAAPASVSYGETFRVETPDASAIAGVTWVRLSSVTHSFNQNQRINRLAFVATEGGLDVTAPSDPALCPPGHYMLFLLSSDGVPSVASIVRIGPSLGPEG